MSQDFFPYFAPPHPIPPLVLGVAALKELGEGADSLSSSPLTKGGLRGVVQGVTNFVQQLITDQIDSYSIIP
jgi:hypothetical protein